MRTSVSILKVLAAQFDKLIGMIFRTFFIAMALSLVTPSCAHLGDTCDTYCVRHGGQCAGVEYGTRRYNTDSGDFKDKPTYFNCRFIN